MPTTLVAGATGYLGRHLVAELHRRGHTVRAIVRDRERAERAGAWGSPPLAGLVDEWVVGNVTAASATKDLAAGVDHVVSALGVTRQKADPWQVDYLANLAVLRSAEAHASSSFTYLNVLGGDSCPAELTRAKSAFAQTLTASPVTAQVVNPTAYFSDMMAILDMARRGVVALFRPDGRINPIHGADLAAYTVDRVESGASGSWDVGGPDVSTWAGLARSAFDALGKKPRTVTIPPAILSPALRLVGLVNPRVADTARFATWNMVHECVAPATGTHRLADAYREAAAVRSGRTLTPTS